MRIDGLKEMKKLRLLNLSNNQITSLDNLNGDTALERLDISNNRVCKLFPQKDLTAVKYLNLSNNMISGSLSPLEPMASLEEIHLKGNPIKRSELNFKAAVRVFYRQVTSLKIVDGTKIEEIAKEQEKEEEVKTVPLTE